MKSVILISKRSVVIQIFTLVCKQLHLSLEVLHEDQLDHKADIIVIDKDFIGDRFNILKSYCKSIGAISKEELSFEIANDFLIPMPFIPSQLYTILENQLELLNKRAKSKVYISNVEVPDESLGALDDYTLNDTYEDEFIIDPLAQKTPQEQSVSINEADNAVDYLAGLADNIALDIHEENDDSIVSVSSVQQGGVLDHQELSALEEIVNDTAQEQMDLDHFAQVQEAKKDEEWLDLSSIIDQAIDEVNTVDEVAHVAHSTSSEEPLRILINNYELEQLKPLLQLLDQNTIDKLSNLQEVNLILKLDNGQ